MPRIRTLKPEALQHRKVGALPDREFRLWIGSIANADDEGRLVADPEQLRVLIFGYHPTVSAQDVTQALAALAATGLIVLYEVKGVPYAALPSWHDHQRIDRPKASKLPPPAGLRSTTHRRSVADPSSSARRSIDGDQGSRIGGIKETPSGAAAPAVVKAIKWSTNGSEGPTTPGSVGFEAYSAAYEKRYGVKPVRNRKANSIFKHLPESIPAEEAPLVAAFYLTRDDVLYIRAKHPVDLLKRDIEKLRTEWATRDSVVGPTPATPRRGIDLGR